MLQGITDELFQKVQAQKYRHYSSFEKAFELFEDSRQEFVDMAVQVGLSHSKV